MTNQQREGPKENVSNYHRLVRNRLLFTDVFPTGVPFVPGLLHSWLWRICACNKVHKLRPSSQIAFYYTPAAGQQASAFCVAHTFFWPSKHLQLAPFLGWPCMGCSTRSIMQLEMKRPLSSHPLLATNAISPQRLHFPAPAHGRSAFHEWPEVLLAIKYAYYTLHSITSTERVRRGREICFNAFAIGTRN